MAEKILYEFESFRLDPIKQQLLRDEELVPLSLRVFDLLLIFVQNPGRDLTREELIECVWKGASVGEGSFDVTLHKARVALGEPKRDPQYILRTSDGYRFVGDVQAVRTSPAPMETQIPAIEDLTEPSSLSVVETSESTRTEESQSVISVPGQWHVLVGSALYASLFSCALFLEVAYQWDHYRRMVLWLVLPVFGWMMTTSVVGLRLELRLSSRGSAGGLVASTVCFLGAVAVLLVVLDFFLPSRPITELTLQAYPAQAAYLKDVCYFLAPALCFLLLPFHFVVAMRREIAVGGRGKAFDLFAGSKVSLARNGIPYPPVWALLALLLVFAGISLALTAHLLDHLAPGPHMNLFTQLVYLRGILYFGLGIECLVWYYQALNELRRGALREMQSG